LLLRHFVKETFVRRRFVKETFCKEMYVCRKKIFIKMTFNIVTTFDTIFSCDLLYTWKKDNMKCSQTENLSKSC
jgi:hypothetical protein